MNVTFLRNAMGRADECSSVEDAAPFPRGRCKTPLVAACCLERAER